MKLVALLSSTLLAIVAISVSAESQYISGMEIQIQAVPAAKLPLARKVISVFTSDICPQLSSFKKDIESSTVTIHDPEMLPHKWKNAFRLEVRFKPHPSDKRLVDWDTFAGACDYYIGGGKNSGWGTRSNACSLPCGLDGKRNEYNFFKNTQFDFLK